MEDAARSLSDNILSVPKKKRSNVSFKSSLYLTDEMIDSPIYDETQMQAILDGIAQNIYQKMDAKGMSITSLADLSGTTPCNLSKIFTYKTSIGLRTLIKVSYALGCIPQELFPYDLNTRKTNGDRFEEITQGLDVSCINYLLEQTASFCRLQTQLKR